MQAIVPQAIEKERIQAATIGNIGPWYHLYNSIVRNNGVKEELIVSIDETPLSFSPNKRMVAVEKGSPVKPTVEKLERYPNATLTIAVTMAGRPLPSQLIWPTAKIPPEFGLLSLENIKVYSNGSGWQTEETFYRYMVDEVFPQLFHIRSIIGDKNEKILIIVDGHSSRANIQLLEFCANNNVILMCIPSHVSHKIQACDCGLNATIKLKIANYTNKFSSKNNDGTKISAFRSKIASSLSNALRDSLTPTNIRGAFTKAGLCNIHGQDTVLKSLPPGNPTDFLDMQKKSLLSGRVLTESETIENIRLQKSKVRRSHTQTQKNILLPTNRVHNNIFSSTICPQNIRNDIKDENTSNDYTHNNELFSTSDRPKRLVAPPKRFDSYLTALSTPPIDYDESSLETSHINSNLEYTDETSSNSILDNSFDYDALELSLDYESSTHYDKEYL